MERKHWSDFHTVLHDGKQPLYLCNYFRCYLSMIKLRGNLWFPLAAQLPRGQAPNWRSQFGAFPSYPSLDEIPSALRAKGIQFTVR